MTKRLLGVLSLVLAAVLVISLAPRTPVNAQSSGGHRITSSSDVVGLFTSCSGTQYLGADGACHNSGSSLPTGLTFSLPTLTISSAGNGNGALALSGTTSGTATCTAPAVAGTSTNPVTCTNALSLGTNPSTSSFLNLPNNASISARNAANNGDVRAVLVDAANNIFIGSGGNPAANIDFSLSTGNVLVLAGTTGTFLNAVQAKRYNVDGATTLVAGDFALNASWGSTASTAITVATAKDSAAVITVTSSGTGQAANPTIVFTFHDGTWTNTPVCQAFQTGGTGVIANMTVSARSATAYTWIWVGTPVAAATYEVTILCTGT